MVPAALANAPDPGWLQEISPTERVASSTDPNGRQSLADSGYPTVTDAGLRGGGARDLARDSSYLELAEAMASGHLAGGQRSRVDADGHPNSLKSATGKSGSGNAPRQYPETIT